MNKIYIASPFFNEEQIAFVKKIEDELESITLDFYSPRLDGILMNMTSEERAQSKRKIYDNNVKNIIDCDIMVAVIDDRDQGTVFEMGYAAAIRKQIITITNKDYDVNIMLAESVYAHLKEFHDLIPAVQAARLGSPWLIDDNRDVY